MDVDTRVLRYFVAVAEEGSLTRAAQRLYVSQPALTKQIKQLETHLGVRLFTRSRTGMTLTEAGRTLAERVPSLLVSLDQALRETTRVLRVGFLASAANEATPQIVAAFTRRRPDWRVEMRQAAWSNPSAGLLDGSVDVALLRMPFPGQENLRVRHLFTEPRWVALPSSHRFADRAEIPFRDLWDEPFVAAPATTGSWRDFWLAMDERDSPPLIGAVTEHPDDWLNAIANGYGVALAPESSARFYARPGITYRPVTGVSPTQVGVAWPPTADPVVRDFVECCAEVAA